VTPNSARSLEVFTEAVQLPIEERVAFLARACAGDGELRRKVEALLKSNDRAGDFLEQPPTGSIGKGRAKVAAGEKPGDRVGRYKLVQQIGEGGCGVVFVAEQEEPVRRRVALKVIKPGMDTKSVIARFEAERQTLALMDHPHIAHVFDAGATENGRPYFVMELVEGVKISDYCDEHSLLLGRRLELFVQVCGAIQHAHQKGIIHRDIKPSNILVMTGTDGKPVPKVIDFGIAKATAGKELTDKTVFTAHEMLIGTPAYMSPEQAALGSSEVDTRTDIYSLGVLLYELLTGTTPFDTRELLKAGFDEVRRVIRDEEPVRPSTRLTTMTAANLASASKHSGADAPKLIREMRGDLDWIVMKAIEKDRTRRYATANGLAMDVGRYLSGEAIVARPPSTAYKFRKLFLRNRPVFIGLSVIFVLLIVSLTVTTRLVLLQRWELKLTAARELEWKANKHAAAKRSDEAEAALREALAIRRRYHGGEPPAENVEVVVASLALARQWGRAEALMNEILTPTALARPEFRGLIPARAELCARNGNWQVAALDAMLLVKQEPERSERYHMLAPLLVAITNLGAYQNVCSNMLVRFGNTTDYHVADRVAKDCLILPQSGVDLGQVAALADLAVTRGSNSSSAAYFQFCKALAEYRLGHHQEALDWSQRAAKGRVAHVQSEATAIIAMSQFKLNQLDKARTALASCNQMNKEDLQKFQSGEMGNTWRDWIIARALQSEAIRMIEDEPFPSARPADLSR